MRTIGNILWFRAISQAGVDRIMVYQYLPPVMTLAIAVVALGERITWVQAGGSVLILVGVAIVQGGERRKPIGDAPNAEQGTIQQSHSRS